MGQSKKYAENFSASSVADDGAQVDVCAEFKSSTRLQCERTRQFRRKLFGCASRTRREQSIRPKISRIDFDVTELENSQVWSGPPKPVVEFHTGRSRASASASATASPAWRRSARAATTAANGAAGRSAAAPGSGARRPDVRGRSAGNHRRRRAGGATTRAASRATRGGATRPTTGAPSRAGGRSRRAGPTRRPRY